MRDEIYVCVATRQTNIQIGKKKQQFYVLFRENSLRYFIFSVILTERNKISAAKMLLRFAFAFASHSVRFHSLVHSFDGWAFFSAQTDFFFAQSNILDQLLFVLMFFSYIYLWISHIHALCEANDI